VENGGYARCVEATDRSDLLTDAIEIAESYLETGDPVRPFMITDRWGDRRVEEFESEQFEGGAVAGAKTRFREFVRSAAGDEQCALVYVVRPRDGEDEIVVERGHAGQPDAEVFVQRFRPKRGRLRRFKLIGDPRPVGTSESAL
jgi:hypothetical protein